MTSISIQCGNNPRSFDWREIVDAAYHNLGQRAGKDVVHLAIDIKNATHFLGNIKMDYDNGLLEDKALYSDISDSYPEDCYEDLVELVFLRAFLFENATPEDILAWSNEIFFPSAAEYICINGKLCGGLCYPQSDDPDAPPMIKETLSDFVIYRPETA